MSSLRILSMIFRCHHTSVMCQAADKAMLSKLRKKTGFSFVNCRQALEKFENDVKQAEQWLRDQAQKEGWSKASKLQGRPMSQGLVAVITDDRSAAMVEVNCETDFVARNSKFQSIVTMAANACLRHGKAANQGKLYFNSQLLGTLEADGKSVADLVALGVGSVGENMAVRRGVYLQTAEKGAVVANYVHATGPDSALLSRSQHQRCSLGKYGALVVCTPVPASANDAHAGHPSPDSKHAGQDLMRPLPLDELGRQLCQHVVGMNPRCIDDASVAVAASREDETRLLHQEFMLDTTLSVSDVLQQNGATVRDFVRFECGEVLANES